MKQKSKIKVTILGCGTSTGVPRPDGSWGNCNPKCQKNYRRRAALLVEKIQDNGKKTVILIDSGPDIREQLYDAHVKQLDAVLYTHAHADHIHGIDDLRVHSFLKRQKNEKLKVYGHKATLAYLYKNFRYCFFSPDEDVYPSILTAQEIYGGEPFIIDGEGGSLEIEPILQFHGKIYSFGFKIGSFAYCIDLHDFSKPALKQLQNLDYLIIESLQMEPHISHLSVPQALEWIDHINPQKAILTAMSGRLDYQEMVLFLSNNPKVTPAYDGLSFEINEHN